MTNRALSGSQMLAEATGDGGYDELDGSIKADLSHNEWQWLSDLEKARFVQNYCEPDAYEDGS